jgi:type VI protein secretion system component VasK
MPVATNPFVEMLWAVLIACLWVAWFALLFRVIRDIFRRRDLSARVMTTWIVVAILLPFLGVFAYMATQKDGMTERKLARAAAREVEDAEFLRDIGAMTQVEFDAVRSKAPSISTPGRPPEYLRAAPTQRGEHSVKLKAARETVGVGG